jgi:hypothetical protein
MTLTIQAMPIMGSNRYEARLLVGNTTLSSGQTSDNEWNAMYIALNLADDYIKEQDEKRKRFEAQPATVYVPAVEVKRYTRGGELIEVEDDAPGYVVDERLPICLSCGAVERHTLIVGEVGCPDSWHKF